VQHDPESASTLEKGASDVSFGLVKVKRLISREPMRVVICGRGVVGACTPISSVVAGLMTLWWKGRRWPSASGKASGFLALDFCRQPARCAGATKFRSFTETFLPGPYALAVSPARYAVERGDWKAAAELQVRPSPLANVQAITYFARALGAARSGNSDAAKTDIAKLAELRDRLRDAKDAYWSEQVDIQRQVATAWVLYAEGKRDDALNGMSAAADAEDRTEKHPVTPGVPKPARELYGVMLLESGNAKDALAAFEATLKKEPNRLGAYVGAAKAAENAGESAKARDYYQKIVAIADGADRTRTEVADARAFLTKR
jgi:hypothetical protein